MKRPPSRLKLIKRQKKYNTEMWSKAVRKRDGNKCLMCPKTEGLSAHHWYYRKGHSLALAYDLRNGATLCYSCHIGRIHRDGDGQFILRFLELMRARTGAEAMAEMDEISRHPHTLTLEELQEMGDKLKYAAGEV